MFYDRIKHFGLLLFFISVLVLYVSYQKISDNSLDLIPEFTPPIVEVQTEALGLSAEEVEALITVPLEADLLNGISWIETIRSKSIPGLSSIVMTFEPDADIWKARQLVQERLTQAHALPNVSKPPVMLQPLSSKNRILKIGLSSSDMSTVDLSVEAHWNIRPRLLGVPGVANVVVWGFQDRQLQVLIDPEQLASLGLSLQQILTTAGNALWYSPLSYLDASAPGSGGFIDTPNQRLAIRHVQPISTPEEFSNVVIEGTGYSLGEVTSIVEDHQPLIGDAIVGGENGLMLVIEKFPWADTVAVTNGIDAAIEELRPGLNGVTIDSSIFRRADLLTVVAQNYWLAIALSLLLIVIAISVLHRNLLTLAVVSVAVPTIFLIAFGALFLLPIRPDILMILGLTAAIGVIVNEATASSREILRTASEDKDFVSVISEVFRVSRGGLAASILIASIATAPFFVLGGLPEAFGISIALGFIIALIIAGLASLTIVPAYWILLSRLSRFKPPSQFILEPIHGIFRWTTWGRPIIACTVMLACGSLFLAWSSSWSVVPDFDDDVAIVHWEGAPGTSHIATNRILQRIVEELGDLDGVAAANAHLGRAVTSDTVLNVNAAQIWLRLTESGKTRGLRNEIETVLEKYPGAATKIQNYTEYVVSDFKPSNTGNEMSIRVYGFEPTLLEQISNKIAEKITAFDGVDSASVESVVSEPVVKIEPDLEKLKPHGLKPGDVRRTAAVIVSGLVVGNIFEEQKVFDVVVWGKPSTRADIESLSDMLVENRNGDRVRLGAVADIRVGNLPSAIYRDAVSRYRDIKITLDETADRKAIEDNLGVIFNVLDFPLEYHAEIVPEQSFTSTNKIWLIAAATLSVFAILLILQASIGGWLLGLMVAVSVIGSTFGALAVIRLSGNAIAAGEIAALLGVIALSIRSILSFIRTCQILEQQGAGFSRATTATAWQSAYSSIVTSHLVTAIALVPFVVLGAQGYGLNVFFGFSQAMLGGVAFSLLVCLLFVPVIYMHFGKGSAKTMQEEAEFQEPGYAS